MNPDFAPFQDELTIDSMTTVINTASIALFVLLVLVGGVIILVLQPRSESRNRLKSRINGLLIQTKDDDIRMSTQTRGRTMFLGGVQQALDLEENLAANFTLAGGLTLLRRGYLVGFGTAIIVFLLCFVFFGVSALPALTISLFTSYATARFFVLTMLERVNTRFLNDFPAALDMIVRGTRAGIPPGNSLALAAAELSAPLKPELERIADRQKIGVSYEDALDEASDRIRLPEFDLFVVTLKLQRQTGGRLAESLDNLSNLLRQRIEVEMKVKTLTSQVRASSLAMLLMPFGIIAILGVFAPELIGFLFTDEAGKNLLLAIGGFIGTGALILRYMSRSVKL